MLLVANDILVDDELTPSISAGSYARSSPTYCLAALNPRLPRKGPALTGRRTAESLIGVPVPLTVRRTILSVRLSKDGLSSTVSRMRLRRQRMGMPQSRRRRLKAEQAASTTTSKTCQALEALLERRCLIKSSIAALHLHLPGRFYPKACIHSAGRSGSAAFCPLAAQVRCSTGSASFLELK